MKILKWILIACLLLPGLSYADRDSYHREKAADAKEDFINLEFEKNTKVVLYNDCIDSRGSRCSRLYEDLEDIDDELEDLYDEYERSRGRYDDDYEPIGYDDEWLDGDDDDWRD